MKKAGLIFVALLGSQLAVAQDYTLHSPEGTLPYTTPEMGMGMGSGGGTVTGAYGGGHYLSYNHEAEGTLPLAVPDTGTGSGGMIKASYSSTHYYEHAPEGSLPNTTGYVSTGTSVQH